MILPVFLLMAHFQLQHILRTPEKIVEGAQNVVPENPQWHRSLFILYSFHITILGVRAPGTEGTQLPRYLPGRHLSENYRSFEIGKNYAKHFEIKKIT